MYDYVNAIMVFVTQIFLGSYVFILTEFKEPVAYWQRLWLWLIFANVSINALLIAFGNFYNTYANVGFLTIIFPYVIITYLCSGDGIKPVLFNISTCLWLGCVGNCFGAIYNVILPTENWIQIPARAITFILMYKIVLYIKSYYRQMLSMLRHAWMPICFTPVVTFLATRIINRLVRDESPLSAAVLVCFITLICSLTYMLLYLLFVRVLRANEVRDEYNLMESQADLMMGQLEQNRDTEEMLRIMRHDMRHKWATITYLIKENNREELLEFIETEQHSLDVAAGETVT